jgi:protein involved in polysaccharide export with SLBB domain
MRLIALVVCLCLAAPLAAQSSPGVAPGRMDVMLHSGDAVRITVWQRPDLSGEFGINGEGRVAHPILKDVIVTGVTFDQAVVRIGELLRTFHGEARFVVEPLIRVGVGGEVRQPNLYHLAPEMTVAYAVARAGGPTDRGRLDRVQFIRGGQALTVDLLDPSGELVHTTLRSGDQILVARRRDILREYVMPLSSVVGAVAAIIRVTR